jgi:hypothetical protein
MRKIRMTRDRLYIKELEEQLQKEKKNAFILILVVCLTQAVTLTIYFLTI